MEAGSEDYGLTPQIVACILGGGMYPSYETYWTALQNELDKTLPMTGILPLPEELKSRWVEGDIHEAG